MTTAFDSQGTLVQISASTTAEVYLTIGEVREFSIQRTAPEIDVSSFDSTFREFLAGLPDGGVINITANMQANATSTGTGQYAIQDAFNSIGSTVANTNNRYQRIILDNSTGTDAALKWTGPILSIGYSGSVDNQISITYSARMNTTSGVWAAAT